MHTIVAIVILNSFFNCTHCHAQIMHQIAFTSHTYIRLTLHCSKGMCVFNSSYYSSKWIFDLVQLLSILIHLLNTNYTLNMKYYLKYELQMSSFILICKYIKVLELESATLEGFCSQLRALSLQILLSYIKCSSQTHYEYHHRCLYSHVSKNVVQPSDICVQTLASPHCSHHCSRCSSACRKISVTQLVETLTAM